MFDVLEWTDAPPKPEYADPLLLTDADRSLSWKKR